MATFSRLTSVIHARLGTSEELAHVLQWQCSKVSDGTPYFPTQAGLDAWALLVSTRWDLDFMVPAQASFMSTELVYDKVTAYSYALDNTLLTVAESTFLANVAGSANNPLPYEVAMCATWRTAVPGRRTRGRTFLGGWAAAAISGQPEGRYTSTCVLQTRNGLKAFMAAMLSTATLDPGGETFITTPIVYSRTADTRTHITQLSIGNVPDVQRRRRTDLIEVDQTTPIP